MTIGGGSDHSLFDDGSVAFCDYYQHNPRAKFCRPCEIAVVADECPDCGAPTTITPSASWFPASMQRSFDAELAAVVPHTTRHAEPVAPNDNYWE